MINRNNYLCFADLEFTCGVSVPYWKSEILSVSVVICDSDYNFVDCYYSTCRPASKCKLTKQCIELTHLTQEEIDQSPDSNNVCKDICDLLRRYNIRNVYVWGNNDRTVINIDAKIHRKNKLECENIRLFAKTIVDIQDKLTEKMGLPEPVNIEDLAPAFGFTPAAGGLHDAYNDAMALYIIQKAVCTTDFRNNHKFTALKQERINRRDEERKRVDDARRSAALSIPLTDREKEYYSQISETGAEKTIRDFFYLRSKIVSALNRNPNDKKFIFVVYHSGVRVFPQSRFCIQKAENILRMKEFSRSNFGEVVVEECRTINQ